MAGVLTAHDKTAHHLGGADLDLVQRHSARNLNLGLLQFEVAGYLEQAMADMNFSARAHDRILKVARTLADLAGAPDIRPNDILEAIQYRSLDRKRFS